MPATKPHYLLTITRPEVMAECWDGVSDELYATLWNAVQHLKPYKGETPPEPDVNSIASVWKLFSEEEKKALNAQAENEVQACAARRAKWRAEYTAKYGD